MHTYNNYEGMDKERRARIVKDIYMFACRR